MSKTSFATSVMSLAALALTGFGGFNYLKTGCPLGSCSSSMSASVRPASSSSGTSSCGSSCSHDGAAKVTQAANAPAEKAEKTGGCCELSATVTTVANDATEGAKSCCGESTDGAACEKESCCKRQNAATGSTPSADTSPTSPTAAKPASDAVDATQPG